MKFKALYDKNAPTRNIYTTIGGFVALLISILAAIGVLTPDQATTATTHTNTLLALLPSAVGAIIGLIGMFKVTDAGVAKWFKPKKTLLLVLLFSLSGLMVSAQINTHHLFGTITKDDFTANKGVKAIGGNVSTEAFLRLAIAETAFEIPLKKGAEGQYFAATGIGLSVAFNQLKEDILTEKFVLNAILFTPNQNPGTNLSTALTIGVPIPKLDLPILNAGIRCEWKTKIAYLQTSITLEF